MSVSPSPERTQDSDAGRQAQETRPAVDIENIVFSWKGHPPILSIKRFSIARGERVFLKGPSGSGKSTLLGLIGGVLLPATGTVRVLGTAVSTLSSSRRDRFRGEHIGFIFQLFNLIPYLSVRENVLLPLQFSPARRQRLAGGPPAEEAGRLLAHLGLRGQGVLERMVTDLSIGQQQRVAAARALIGRPELLIADEPTSALDADTRTAFLDLLTSECKAFGTSLLFVSHDAALASRLDRSVALADINSVSTPRE
jgi:putative ABC transport system ATP-binding protein